MASSLKAYADLHFRNVGHAFGEWDAVPHS